MIYAADLHIHTALSPCSDNDMTPNNIVNMSYLKGLEVIAITDHNSAENVAAVIECSKARDILVVPGIEVASREEVHVLCYFPDIWSVVQMQQHIYDKLPYIMNRKDIFGDQIILDSNDKISGSVLPLLLGAVDMSLDEIVFLADRLGGVALPAHVDRDANSIISNLGAIPEDAGFKTIELSRGCSEEKRRSFKSFISEYNIIKSSDAHNLASISEKDFFLPLKKKDASSVIDYLKRN